MKIDGEYVVSSVLKQLKSQVSSVQKRYREDQVQNIVRPCFFVKQLLLGSDKLMNDRYFRNYRIRITYLPKDLANPEVECRSMGEELLGVFRILSLEDGSAKVFGRNAEFEVVDGELLFTVEFPMHVQWERNPQPQMQNLDSDIEYKS